MLDHLTGLPAGVIVVVSVFYGAAMWFTGTRSRPAATAVVALIAVNPVWAVVCLLPAAGDLAHPTTLGAVLLVAEAGIVTTLAVLESVAFRPRSRPERTAEVPVRA